PDLVAQVVHPDAPPAASAFVVDVVGFDWNCPQYIEPRFTRAEIAAELRPLLTEAADLRAEVARLRDLPVIPGSREGL
ncbi:hypothetical protein FV219_24610, partial [Methylobacterium sp. WL122]